MALYTAQNTPHPVAPSLQDFLIYRAIIKKQNHHQHRDIANNVYQMFCFDLPRQNGDFCFFVFQ
jgi:hypothetical protein